MSKISDLPSLQKQFKSSSINPVSTRPICILVLGMHRSGTSAVTRVLSMAGAKLPVDLMGPGTGNEVGHWESNRLVQFHDDILAELGSKWYDWRALVAEQLPVKRRREIKTEISGILSVEYDEAPLFVVKDPRICRFVPLFLEALDEAGYDVRIVIPLRNPLEVCESLERRKKFWASDRSRADAALLWLRHVLDAEVLSRGQKRALFTYNDFLSDWRTSFEKLTEQIGLKWPYEVDDIAPQVDEFLAPALRHHSHSSEELLLDPILRDWISDAWQALKVLSCTPDSTTALRQLDDIRSIFNQAAPIIYRLHEQAQHIWEKQVAELQDMILQMTEKDEQLSKKIEQLDYELAAKAADLDEKEAARAETESVCNQIGESLCDVRETMHRMENSLSWKITRPFRFIRRQQSRILKLARATPAGIRMGGGLRLTLRKVTSVYRQDGLVGLRARVGRYVAQKTQNNMLLTGVNSVESSIQTQENSLFDHNRVDENTPKSFEIMTNIRNSHWSVESFEECRESLESISDKFNHIGNRK